MRFNEKVNKVLLSEEMNLADNYTSGKAREYAQKGKLEEWIHDEIRELSCHIHLLDVL